jgi:tetratricopeptide (TPR) repeat protein
LGNLWGGLPWYGDYGYGGYGYGGYGYAGYAPLYDPGMYDTGEAPQAPVDDNAYSGAYAALDQTETQPGAATEEGNPGDEFLSNARDAFARGQYSEAARLASHAAVETPRNAKVHELLSLALFALKDYRGSNMEAHAALALAPPADWETLFNYYGDMATYTQQLDTLAKYLTENRQAADARFVLAYHDMMMGHAAEARSELAQVVKMVPKDKLAASLLDKLSGTAPQQTTLPPVPPKPGATVAPVAGPREM